MSEERKKRGDKCKGKFDFCWPWHEFTNGNMDYGQKAKGLAFNSLTNITTMKKTRNLPFIRYGSKKDETVALNFCPWCGADYKKLKRV